MILSFANDFQHHPINLDICLFYFNVEVTEAIEVIEAVDTNDFLIDKTLLVVLALKPVFDDLLKSYDLRLLKQNRGQT